MVGQRTGPLLARPVSISDRLVHAFPGPVRTAEWTADASSLDLPVHRVDEFADRHVEIVPVHEVDVDMVCLKPVERLRQLFTDHVGVAEGCVSALADDD